jgi:CRISPR/Cas system-associated endoribonuclease Cas2
MVKKKKTKYQLQNLSRHRLFQTLSAGKQVLLVLAEMAEDYIDFIDTLYAKSWGRKQLFDARRVRSHLQYLEKKGYVKRKMQSGKSLYRLTQAGGLEVEKLIINFKYENMRWDGRWRFVIFDIPENKKNLRNGLRWTLKALGFKKVQASVWAFPYDIFDDLEKLIPDIKRHLWIKLIESDRIINDKDIYRRFFRHSRN